MIDAGTVKLLINCLLQRAKHFFLDTPRGRRHWIGRRDPRGILTAGNGVGPSLGNISRAQYDSGSRCDGRCGRKHPSSCRPS